MTGPKLTPPRVTDSREWSIKGWDQGVGDQTRITIATCDGPVPEINEIIEVVPKARLDAALREIEHLKKSLAFAQGMLEEFGLLM
jgi:hypothetical protein